MVVACRPLLALQAGGELRVAQLAPALDGGDLALLVLDHRVEGVDHLLRIEQRIEAVIGPQLEQLVKLALGLFGLVR